MGKAHKKRGHIVLYLVVKLFGRAGVRGEFWEYENKALDLFRKHGGEVVAAFAPAPAGPGIEMPDEIQILKMADRAEFDTFMKDPARVDMAAERDRVIRKTEVYLSEAIIDYAALGGDLL